MADSEASSRLRLGWVPEWEQRAPPARIPCRPPLRKPRSGARTERCLSYPLPLYSRASFPAVYNRSHICETECKAILEIYDEKSGAPISLLDSLRSRERGDLVQVVGIGEKARFGRIVPLIQLQQVGNPMSLFDGSTVVDEAGRHILRGYDKDAL